MRLSPEARKLLQELGRIGGKKGGKARAERMTPEQRKEAARKAVQVRWARKYVKRSMHAYLEGLQELPWVVGILRSSGIPTDEINEMMESLRPYGSETRWKALLKQLQPKARKME